MTSHFQLASPKPLTLAGQPTDLKKAQTTLCAAEPIYANFILLGKTLRIGLDPKLAEACGSADELLAVLQSCANELPDRKRFQSLKPKSEAEVAAQLIELTLVSLDSSSSLLNLQHSILGVVLDDSLPTKPPASVIRMLVAVGVFRCLRHRVNKKSPTLKTDLGTALLALAYDNDARASLDHTTIRSTLGPLLGADNEFVSGLANALERSPLQSKSDKLSPENNIYFNPRKFDELSPGHKFRVVLAGQLAWWTTLSLGVLALFRGVFDRWPGHYSEARDALTGQVQSQGLVKRRLRRKFDEMFKRGRLLAAMELFWSSWNPALTRVALRPFYRWVGGNSRPFWATLLSFWFSGGVVHLMALSTAIIACAYPWRDTSRVAQFLASDQVVNIQLTIWVVYTVFGTLVGLVKLSRARRVRR